MNFSRFISARIKASEKGSFSSTINKIAIASISTGIFIMIITFSILNGFQKNIQNKIFSFGGHIQISKYDLNQSFQENAIEINPKFIALCKADSGIKSVNIYSNKAGLIKANEEVHGVVLKGVNKDYPAAYFSSNIKSGRFLTFEDSNATNEVLISTKVAQNLKLKLGDAFVIHFIQNPPRSRKLTIVGLYNTGMEEFDENIIIGDLRLIQKLNKWTPTMAGGYEINLKDFKEIDLIATKVYEKMDYNLGLEKISDKYLAIFDWLDLLDQNVLIFLSLILVVAAFNMISSLLILIMERTQMIGVLKALGASNRMISEIFFYNGLYLVGIGLLIGNACALTFCAIQYHFELIPLDPQSYYMNSVPIYWAWGLFGWINLTIFSIMTITLFVPTFVITKISPTRAIKFS